ncbi:MAG: AEC family transporter [Erysipelotrichaceae bacterium]|nr:AEC family transporter [Erysipelotrichaceae bacterium]
MKDLLFSLNIVMPMAGLLAIGYLFKKSGFFDESFLHVGKKFCFYVLLSCSLFKNLYDSDLDGLPYRFIVFTVLALLVEIFLSFIIAGKISDKRSQTGVIIQGSFRSNFAYIGIPLATMFFTDEALIARTQSEISLLSIFVIPIFNVVSVIALLKYTDNKDDTSLLNRSIHGILRNPCIISVVCGLMVLLIRLAIPSCAFLIRDHLSFVYKILSYLSSMSTPFAFLMVGASLDLSSSIRNLKKLTAVVLLKDLIFPALALSAAYLLKVADNVQYAILVSIFASPTAVASAIMASQMGGDQELADEIVMYTTIFSMVPLLIIIYCLKIAGCV